MIAGIASYLEKNESLNSKEPTSTAPTKCVKSLREKSDDDGGSALRSELREERKLALY
jgi:hypothetical protein